MKQIKQPWTHTMLTTTFWILVKTFIHKICNLQREQPVYRFKAKTLHKWNSSNNHFFDWQQECFDFKDNLYNQFFIFQFFVNVTVSWTFLNKDTCNPFCLE